MNAWRFLDTGALPGALNMAVDQAILGLHANGKSPPTLRFYQWTPPAVSLGFCQKNHNLDLAACRRLGIEVVRRPSGGRAVLHLGDLTYAVIAGTADGIPSAVTAAYRLICDGLLQGFRRLGIDARHGPRRHQTAAAGHLLSEGNIGFHCVSGEEVCGERPDLARLLHAATRVHHFSAADRGLGEFMAGERRFPGGVAS